MSAAITSAGLTKRFHGGQVAVDAIDLDVPRGAVYGFLGPNGSGKTTTIRMLLGLVAATAGSHTLLGEPMPGGGPRVLPAVGALVEGPAFHPYLSGRDNLLRLDAADRTVSARSTRRRTDHALERVGLTAAATKRYRSYSLGMRQRLGLAAALLRPRELLVLDEPTNGLDPQGTREVRSLVRQLGAGGATVFVSSHLLSRDRAGVRPRRGDEPRTPGVPGDARRAAPGRQPAGARRDQPARGRSAGAACGRHRCARGAGRRPSSPTSPPRVASRCRPSCWPSAWSPPACRCASSSSRAPGLEDLFVGLTGEGFDVDE